MFSFAACLGQGLQSTECGNGRSKTLLPFVSLVFSTIDCVIRAALKLTKAPLLSFGWLGTGSRVASGEDGWETVLGSIAPRTLTACGIIKGEIRSLPVFLLFFRFA